MSPVASAESEGTEPAAGLRAGKRNSPHVVPVQPTVLSFPCVLTILCARLYLGWRRSVLRQYMAPARVIMACRRRRRDLTTINWLIYIFATVSFMRL